MSYILKERPILHWSIYQVTLMVMMMSQVYEDIMRLFSETTVEASHAVYSHNGGDSKRQEYRSAHLHSTYFLP